MKALHREIHIMVDMSVSRDVYLIVYGNCLNLVQVCI